MKKIFTGKRKLNKMKKTIAILVLTTLLFSCVKENKPYEITLGQVIDYDFLSATFHIKIKAPVPGDVEVGTVTSVYTNPALKNEIISKFDLDIDESEWTIYGHEVQVADVLVKNYIKAYVKKGDDVYYSEEIAFVPKSCDGDILSNTISTSNYNMSFGPLVNNFSANYTTTEISSNEPRKFTFEFNTIPNTGVYTNSNTNFEDNEVIITHDPGGALSGYSWNGYEGHKIFVKNTNGKLEISFCSLGIENAISSINFSGHISEN